MGKHCCDSCSRGKTCDSELQKIAAGECPIKRKACCSKCSYVQTCKISKKHCPCISSCNSCNNAESGCTAAGTPSDNSTGGTDRGGDNADRDDAAVTEACNTHIPSYSIISESATDMMNRMTKEMLTDPQVKNHSPDGFLRVEAREWEISKWTPKTPKKLCDHASGTKWKELVNWLFPVIDGVWYTKTMRGLRERFYEVKPFKDIKNPTVKEIENWFLETVNHLRALVGISDKVVLKPMLSIISRVSDELENRVDEWKDCSSKCSIGVSAKKHCGMFWKPVDPICEEKYKKMRGNYCIENFEFNDEETMEGWYGVSPKMPWSNVFITNFHHSFMTEGLYGGHAYPFFAKNEIGFSVWIDRDGKYSYRVSHAGPASKICGKSF
jgi:hypothetical protein